MKGKDKQIQMSETTAVMMALTISGGLQDAYSYFVRGHVFANALTSFACAMQVQAFRKVNGYAYASTMCIGNLRSGMEAFSAFLRTREKKLLKQAGQYFLVIFLFFIGAGIGGAVSMCLGQQQYIILIACGLLLISFLMMLRRED